MCALAANSFDAGRCDWDQLCYIVKGQAADIISWWRSTWNTTEIRSSMASKTYRVLIYMFFKFFLWWSMPCPISPSFPPWRRAVWIQIPIQPGRRCTANYLIDAVGVYIIRVLVGSSNVGMQLIGERQNLLGPFVFILKNNSRNLFEFAA